MSELSIQDGKPVYKFLFANGATEYLYTSASYFISDAGGTWEPVALTASDVTQSNELAKNGIKIELPRDNEVAALFLGVGPEQTVTLTVFRGHDGDAHSDFRFWWKGRVASTSANGDTVTLNCEDVFTSMQRPGLRARYQKGCRHALYSSSCGVVKDDFSVAVDLTDQSGFTLDFTLQTTPPTFDDGYFAGGIVELSDGTMRYITKHVGGVLTLIEPFDGLDLTSSVAAELFPGCLHNTTDCLDKFANLDNYGGFPFLPGKNPFSGSVEGSIV